MRKLYLIVFLFAGILNCTNAQYKKASFLTKNGRTYDLGTCARIMGNGNSSAVGFYFSWGKENNTKRLFHWFDLEYTLGHKYKYNTTAQLYSGGNPIDLPVSISGKSGTSFTYRYNLAFYILNNENEENKFLPFVDLNAGWSIAGSATKNKTVEPNNLGVYYKKVLPYTGAFAIGGGVGFVYKVKSNLGIKFTANYYSIILSKEKLEVQVNDPTFITVPSHIGINVGVRWLLDSDND